jgi:TolB-like protein/tetratricopeptide (TPR) repeat protein
MRRWFRHHVVEAMPGHVVGWVVGGAIVALSGVSPDDWVAHLVHATSEFLPNDWSTASSALIARSAFAAVGVAIIAPTLVFGRRAKREPIGVAVPKPVAPPQPAPPPALALPDKPSIAVLPFQNLSGDAEQEYFCDGMVEDITAALARVKWLFVIARNSSFTYKGKTIDVKQVGRELGVRYILEGSVRKANNRVRLTGQLIDAGSGSHIWADRFEGDLQDVFDLQDKITASVVGAIGPALTVSEMQRARTKPPESLDAYDYFLRGLYSFRLITRTGAEESLHCCRRALELDPTYASAHGLAAWAVALKRVQGWNPSAEEEREALVHVRAAIEYGANDAFAFQAAGQAALLIAHDHDLALTAAETALSLDPNLAEAWSTSGWANFNLGNGALAIEKFERALRLSPANRAYTIRSGIAFGHFLEGRYEESVRWADMSLREQPRWATAVRCKTSALGLLGRTDEAAKALRALSELQPGAKIAQFRSLMPLKRPEHMERYLDGLRRAGVPE